MISQCHKLSFSVCHMLDKPQFLQKMELTQTREGNSKSSLFQGGTDWFNNRRRDEVNLIRTFSIDCFLTSNCAPTKRGPTLKDRQEFLYG